MLEIEEEEVLSLGREPGLRQENGRKERSEKGLLKNQRQQARQV